MPVPTDREKAERAKDRANEASTSEFDVVGILCPACNEPVTICEPNPNEYIHSDDGETYTNDRAAYEISPARIIESDHDNPWDAIHVVPEVAEVDLGDRVEQVLKVIAYKHDHTSESYELWQEQLDALEETERRAEENRGLGDYATDGGTTAEEVLDNNGVGQNDGYTGDGYGGSETAMEAIEAFVDECVTDQLVVSSRSIENGTDVGARAQEIGKTLGARLDGRTPDGFLDDVELGKWRDTRPTKWVFTRVAGEATGRQTGRTLRKPELVREISAALDVTDGYRCHHTDETERVDIRASWMRTVLKAVATAAGDNLESYLSDEQPAYVDDPIDELTITGVSRVLERILDTNETLGTSEGWPRSTLLVIHAILVDGCGPSEVAP
ncbi:hypothetical protein C461_03297 [Halorubrum aidingense JCM 13560]|uniref:Uncharacterized protein n=1 Tax=Halorubrum aidingense JCM 13560 TaxID=1230454 RepID=M0PGY8_9EURY|nr:hypothetical protein [Halorubrum aidingense]EMA69168.1 hypothetical protein C461_03297 [Halorubrum aidingense JCM 13560]